MALERMASKSSGGGVESRHASGIPSGAIEASTRRSGKTVATQAQSPEQGRGIGSGVADKVARLPVGVASGPPEAKPKRGRPLQRDKHRTLTATKPWEAEGMDRSTWYRRRQKEAKK